MKLSAEWCRGSWLMRLLEDTGFGDKVEVRPFTSYTEATSLDVLTDNMMLANAMFFPGYQEEELSRVRPILRRELSALEAYEEGDGFARIRMTALVGFAWK